MDIINASDKIMYKNHRKGENVEIKEIFYIKINLKIVLEWNSQLFKAS